MTDKTTQQKLDDATFKVHEFEQMIRCPVRGFYAPQSTRYDKIETGSLIVTVIVPPGFVVGPGSKVVFVNEGD